MSTNIIIDNDYLELINTLKSTVQTAHLRSHRAVNTELIRMYWQIGRTLLEKQKVEAWGSKYLEQVSSDMTAAFPGIKGFSKRNIERMINFSGCFPVCDFAAQAVPQLPWGHIILLMQKFKKHSTQEWYAQQAIEQGWSRNVLNMMIKSDLYTRQKQAPKITNFKQTLPALESDMAQELFKDPYNFEFLNIEKPAKEREIENALVSNITKFLLHLGKGFAFIGNQYKVDVAGDEFFIDILLFNTKLNCHVVIELKVGKFQPADSGQLNFYTTVIDEQVKENHHAPTIGILLCENKNEVVAEYSLKKIDSPIGISKYELGHALTQHLKMMREERKSLIEKKENKNEVDLIEQL